MYISSVHAPATLFSLVPIWYMYISLVLNSTRTSYVWCVLVFFFCHFFLFRIHSATNSKLDLTLKELGLYDRETERRIDIATLQYMYWPHIAHFFRESTKAKSNRGTATRVQRYCHGEPKQKGESSKTEGIESGEREDRRSTNAGGTAALVSAREERTNWRSCAEGENHNCLLSDCTALTLSGLDLVFFFICSSIGKRKKRQKKKENQDMTHTAMRARVLNWYSNIRLVHVEIIFSDCFSD